MFDTYKVIFILRFIMLLRFMIPLLTIAMMLANTSVFAGANSVVSGRITDYSTGVPLTAASVSLHKVKDSILVTGKITDKNGTFAFNDLPDDNYFLKVNYVGYEPKLISPIALSKTTQMVEYGNIGLLQSSSVTGEVLVTGERPLIEYQMGKQVLNVDKTITASNGNALDVLKTAPSVEVDAEGQVSLRGSSNVKILIDGKPSPAEGTNLANVLAQIPAGSIENVELITNPSAKYDAEGMSGIINIILKKKRESGLNGLANLNIGNYDKYSAALSLNYNTGKMNIFGNYDHYSHIRKSGQEVMRETYSLLGTSYLNQNADNFHNLKRHYGKLGIEYNLDNRNFLTVSGGYTNAGNKMRGTIDYNNVDYNNSLVEANLRQYNVNQPQINYEASASHRLSFEQKGQELTTDVSYNEFVLDNNSGNRYFYLNLDGSHSQRPLFIQSISSLNNIKTGIFQSDYVHPFSANSKLESGAKATYSKYNSNNKNLNYDYDELDWVLDRDASNHFIYDESVLSLYAMYSGMIDKFSFQAGLRGEQTNTTGDLQTTGEKFSSDYFDLFPSLVLSYNITQADQVQLSYSRRIDRPQVWLVNPFKDKTDPSSVRAGNPELKPVYTDSYELGFIKYFGTSMITPSLFLRKSSDVMTMYTKFNSTDQKIYHTYMNYSDGISYGLDLSYQTRISDWLNIGANFSYYKNDVSVNNPELPKYEKSEYFWNGRINGNITIIKNLSAQVFAIYMPKTVTPQGMRHESYWTDFALKYEFLDSDASAVFKISNAFDTQKWGGYAKGDSFKFTNTYMPESQLMSIGFSYKINNGLKQQRPKNRTQPEQSPSDMF